MHATEWSRSNLLVHVFHANTLTKGIATKFVTHQKTTPLLVQQFLPMP